jgi:hypothetical protein
MLLQRQAEERVCAKGRKKKEYVPDYTMYSIIYFLISLTAEP